MHCRAAQRVSVNSSCIFDSLTQDRTYSVTYCQHQMMVWPLSKKHQLVTQVCIFCNICDLRLFDLKLCSHLLFFYHKLATLILPPVSNCKCVCTWHVHTGGWSVICKDLININANSWRCLCVQAAAGNIINMLWQLMENGLEELKLLQTVLVLLTTNTVVHDEVLSKV